MAGVELEMRQMLKYVIRRVLYMVPTVFGVILITFALFNMAGGDPALMRLGKQAAADTMEAYDVQRGLNKPLFAGMWGRTRAYEATDFSVNAGSWSKLEGVEYAGRAKGYIVLSKTGEYEADRRLPLNPGEDYQWVVKCRLSNQGNARFLVKEGDTELASVQIPESRSFRTLRIPFVAGASEASLRSLIVIKAGSLDVTDIKIQRRVRHIFDSQFVFYISQILRFDFGVSDETNQRVSKMIKDGILPSLALTAPMFLVGLITAIVVSLICAYMRNTFLDRFFVVFSILLMSINYLVWIILGQYLFAYRLHWFPIWGFESMRFLVLPAIIGVISGLGSNIRFYRTVILDEMYCDYVRTALAKGVSKPSLLFKHVLKNAMIPILTSVVIAIPFLYTGSLLLETFFGIPGLGSMSINAINSSDFDVIRAVVFVGAMIYVVANLLTDICYAAVDPRVKLK